ncbi:MAG: ROK family protein [Anaerotruncus massiliensis (ex Togo et al. 2019)]
MQRTVNHDDMRSANMESVFDCIRAHAPVTKRQIQSLTGLSWGSVSNLCSILLERGVLRELPVRTEGAGRNPSGFDINLKDNLIIGLDVNLSGLTGVVCDLRSRVLARVWRPTEGRKGEDILRLMKEAAAELLGQTAAGTVKGLAIAFPGQVDAERGVSLWTHQFGSLSEVNMREIFQRAFGLEVLLEHDPNCMAVCEHWMGAAQDVEDFLFVRLSYGIVWASSRAARSTAATAARRARSAT